MESSCAALPDCSPSQCWELLRRKIRRRSLKRHFCPYRAPPGRARARKSSTKAIAIPVRRAITTWRSGCAIRCRHFGLRAWIESFTATVYTPRLLELQLLSSPPVTFDLHDGKIAADPDGSRPGAGLPFNAGSGNGDIRAPLVEVGRGLDADYARLARTRVTVRSKIVLIRYGAEYRGNLAARAQSNGAAAVIFYNSPKDEVARPSLSERTEPAARRRAARRCDGRR